MRSIRFLLFEIKRVFVNNSTSIKLTDLFILHFFIQNVYADKKGFKITYKGSNYYRKWQLSEILTAPLNPREMLLKSLKWMVLIKPCRMGGWGEDQHCFASNSLHISPIHSDTVLYSSHNIFLSSIPLFLATWGGGRPPWKECWGTTQSVNIWLTSKIIFFKEKGSNTFPLSTSSRVWHKKN